ncbi:hypothetical protein B0H14DRAFT_3508317 [Mycena olivaceomarginata]|nr:hypothetical protein B0H14DRAFT_3508317 [Mycena olivaceomarginata]
MSETIRRIPSRINTAATKATNKARGEISQLFSFSLKEKGVVPDSTRDMINDLVALDGVRPNKVVGVLKRIAGKLGIGVTGNISDRTARRIVKEGGVASRMQFVEAVGTSADQKKLFRLIAAMKERLERERRGEETLRQMAPKEWAQKLFQVSQDTVTAAGGIAAWEKLPDAERRARHKAALAAFEKQSVDLFIWGGCCMHKQLNVFKGAVLAMQEWWIENGLPGPLKMYNRDNAAAVTLGEGTEAAARAEDRTLRDIRRIEKAIEAESVRLHPDDGQSTLRWVEKLRAEDKLLGFKAKSDLPPAGSGLDPDAFVLMLQTKWQKKKFEQYGEQLLCINATHNTTVYENLNLTTAGSKL